MSDLDLERSPTVSPLGVRQYGSFEGRSSSLTPPPGTGRVNPFNPRPRQDTIIKRVPGLKKTVLGKFKGLDLLDREEWLFLSAGMLSIVTTMCFTIYRLIAMASVGPDSDDMLLGIILLVNTLFASYYLVHGVARDQYFDTVTFLITTLVVIGYVFLNFFGRDESKAVNEMDLLHPTIKLARLIVTCLLGIPVVGLGIAIVARYWRSNYMLFRLVGARTDLQTACSNVLVTHTLISLTVNASISFLIALHYIKLLERDTTSAIVFTGGVVFAFLWALLGYLSVRFEKTIWTIFFVILALLLPAYAIYDCIMLSYEEPGYSIRFGAAALSSAILTASVVMVAISATYAVTNFNKGLYERMYAMEDDQTWSVVTSRPTGTEIGGPA